MIQVCLATLQMSAEERSHIFFHYLMLFDMCKLTDNSFLVQCHIGTIPSNVIIIAKVVSLSTRKSAGNCRYGQLLSMSSHVISHEDFNSVYFDLSIAPYIIDSLSLKSGDVTLICNYISGRHYDCLGLIPRTYRNASFNPTKLLSPQTDSEPQLMSKIYIVHF